MIELRVDNYKKCFYFVKRQFLRGSKRVVPYINHQQSVIEVYDEKRIIEIDSDDKNNAKFKHDLFHHLTNGFTYDEIARFLKDLPFALNAEIITKFDSYAVSMLIEYTKNSIHDYYGQKPNNEINERLSDMICKIDNALTK